MSNITDPKSYPVTSPEVAEMFGLSSNNAGKNQAQGVSAQEETGGTKVDFAQVVGNLYIKEPQGNKNPGGVVVDAEHVAVPATTKPKQTGSASHPAHAEAGKMELPGHEPVPARNLFNAIKTITPYIVVFSVALLVYFYFFGSASFDLASAFKSQTTKVSTPKESSLAQLESQNLAAYQQWIGQFYYDVSDPKVVDPESDNSGNGLSNFQKYLLNLNPKSYDTIGLGQSDSESLNDGINPLSGTKLSDAQKSIIDKYFDMEVVMNRLAMAQLQKNGQVAGANTVQATVPAILPGYSSFGAVQGSANNQGTASNNQDSGNNNQVAFVPSADDLGGSALDIDTGKPGHLEVPSLKISAPIIWSQDVNSFDRDLQNGVIHYPGTAMPGQIGTAYISGHSSNYTWAKGDYNHVFTHLGDLADNISFQVTVTLKGGKTATLHYVVAGRQQYNPKDQAQFKNTAKSVVALSTCWPVGSTAKRLVVFGELVQVEKQANKLISE